MKYLRRLIWFLASKAFVITVIAALLIVGFYMAMNTANIFILLTDGMEARVNAVLDEVEPETLQDFFSDKFLANDPVLNTYWSGNSAYDSYNIESYNHTLNLSWMWSWPWSNTAQAEITETVFGIKGSVISERKKLVEAGSLDEKPPKWQGGRYDIGLVRVEGRWKIDSLRLISEIIELDPTPAPTEMQEQPVEAVG